MNKLVLGMALTAAAICGVVALAYSVGKEKGYTEGLRDADSTDDAIKPVTEGEAEGEAIEPSATDDTRAEAEGTVCEPMPAMEVSDEISG